MPPGIWFWLIYVLFVLAGLFFNWPRDTNAPNAWHPFGWSVVVLVLLGLLGWGVFGPPIR